MLARSRACAVAMTHLRLHHVAMVSISLSTAAPLHAESPASILRALLPTHRRILLFGPPGVGKTTLTAALARELASDGTPCWCISADPGSPGLGVPGAVSIGTWRDGQWQTAALEALCTLDAGRFRLPLVSALRRLAARTTDGVLLIDGPGVVRGVAGSELLSGIADAANIDALLVVSAADRAPPLWDDLRTLRADAFLVHAAPAAQRPGKLPRARARTARWDSYLADAWEQTVDLTAVVCSGTPPPIGVASAWVGRQIAFLEAENLRGLGEVLRAQGHTLAVKAPVDLTGITSILVRDAARDASGLLATAVPFAAERLDYTPPATRGMDQDGGPRLMGRVGAVDVNLINGVFGDPLLHLRLRHSGRSLLFDLGSGERLSARTAHHVSDVFITHAHMDHISGFLWLLRSRIAELPACRLFGPPGLAHHIASFVDAILWDRVAERAPRFEVAELHGQTLRRYAIQAGRAAYEAVDERAAPDGVLWGEPGFRVRAITLDHGTPVLAYAFEPAAQINVRKDRLLARDLAPGAWLGALKVALLDGHEDALIALPDGSASRARDLAADIVLITPGKRLVYATDFADTQENRQRLTRFARHAHTFFCEATFREEDAEQAACTQHLTTRACGEIAMDAEVARLVPFHFSRRYADDPLPLYQQIAAACPRVVTPAAFSIPED